MIRIDLRSRTHAVVTLSPPLLRRLLGARTEHRDAVLNRWGGWQWCGGALVEPRVRRAIDLELRRTEWECIWARRATAPPS